MNTVTHALVAAAVLARRKAPTPNRLVFLGSITPDLFILVFYVWTKSFTTLSEGEIWGEAYWTQPWQTFSAVSNSAPLAALLLAAGLWRRLPALSLFAAALLLHALLDFPVHADDAHRHFWPLTDWRFVSPLSYWDVNHHARWVALGEAVLLSGAALVLWRRFPARLIRLSLAAFVAVYWALLAFLAL